MTSKSDLETFGGIVYNPFDTVGFLVYAFLDPFPVQTYVKQLIQTGIPVCFVFSFYKLHSSLLCCFLRLLFLVLFSEYRTL